MGVSERKKGRKGFLLSNSLPLPPLPLLPARLALLSSSPSLTLPSPLALPYPSPHQDLDHAPGYPLLALQGIITKAAKARWASFVLKV